MGNETNIRVNSEIKVTSETTCSIIFGFYGQTGVVTKVMEDGHTLDVKLANGKRAMIDAALVSVIQEAGQTAKSDSGLGVPIIHSSELKETQDPLKTRRAA